MMRVIDVVVETSEASTLVLEQVSGEPLNYRPGQFLTLRVPPDRHGGVARCYSMCSSPWADEHPAITVKRTRGGHASNWLCDEVRPGMELEVLPPAGTFVPSTLDADVLLVAGGSGITPLLSILTSILVSGRGRVQLVYANRDETSVIFAERIEALVRAYPDRLAVDHWHESSRGLPTSAALGPVLAPFVDRTCYVCGPQPLMDVVTESLTRLGVSRSRILLEKFQSLTGDPFAPVVASVAVGGPSTDLVVTLDGACTELTWRPGERLLDLLLASGIQAPFSCREGNCSACACVLQEGQVHLERNEVLDAADLADGIILACQATPTSELVRVSFDG